MPITSEDIVRKRLKLREIVKSGEMPEEGLVRAVSGPPTTPSPPKPKPSLPSTRTPEERVAQIMGLPTKAEMQERAREPELPKTKVIGLPEYTRTEFIQEQQKRLKTIRETKGEIYPSAQYRIPMIGGRHVSPKELEEYRKTKPPGWIPQYQIFTGTEVLSLLETQYQNIRQHIVKIGEYPAETKFKKTKTGYEVKAPPEPMSLAKWKKQEYMGAGALGIIRRGAATFLGGAFQPEWAYERMFGSPQKAEEIITGWEYGAKQAVKRGGLEYAKYIAVSPPMTGFVYPFAGAAALGAGIGALKMTAWGAKPIAKVAFSYPPAITKPITTTITPSKLIETGIVGYGVYETGKAIREKPIATLKHLAVTFPLIYAGYRYGAVKGMGWVQRRAAMAKVTGISRVRQKAIYEATDIMWKRGKGIRPLEKPFDLVRVERLTQKTMMDVSRFLSTEQKRWIFGGRPRIGGAAAMEMYGVKRTGIVPPALKQWAMQRQIISGRPRAMMGAEAPKDIDIWIRSMYKDIMGGMKRAKEIRIPHVIDVPKVGYKSGRYYWGGWTELPSARAGIYGVPTKTRIPKFRELVMRKAVSILPSETQVTGYRSYKDIFDFFYMAQKVKSKKLAGAINKIVHPERYIIPKKTIGERFIKRIGGAVEPTYKEDVFGIYPTYPKAVYPSYYAPIGYAGYYISKPSKYILPAGRYQVLPYTPPKYLSYKVPPSKPTIYIPQIKIPSYKLSPYKFPKYPYYPSPPKAPPYKAPKYPPAVSLLAPIYKTPKIPIPDVGKRRKRPEDMEDWLKKYKQREFKIPDISKVTEQIMKGMKF